MVIKTNMNKTYDKIEWTFIQALLTKMGVFTALDLVDDGIHHISAI